MSEIESSYRVTGDELRKFIERIERLDAEKKDLIEQQKEVLGKLKQGDSTSFIDQENPLLNIVRSIHFPHCSPLFCISNTKAVLFISLESVFVNTSSNE